VPAFGVLDVYLYETEEARVPTKTGADALFAKGESLVIS